MEVKDRWDGEDTILYFLVIHMFDRRTHKMCLRGCATEKANNYRQSQARPRNPQHFPRISSGPGGAFPDILRQFHIADLRLTTRASAYLQRYYVNTFSALERVHLFGQATLHDDHVQPISAFNFYDSRALLHPFFA
jgi:hypothetical protein